jgi:hypothetical protein
MSYASSVARTLAAHANGAKSKGPVTPEGRARSSQNALRHGLSAKAVVLHGEDPADFEQLRESYIQRFQPADQPELDLVETMVSARWRMRRVPMLEVEVLENIHYRYQGKIETQLDDHAPFNKRMGWVFLEAAQGKSLALLVRYEGQFTRTYERSLKALQILQKARLAAPAEELQNEPKPMLLLPPAPPPSTHKFEVWPDGTARISPNPGNGLDISPGRAARLSERFQETPARGYSGSVS